MKDSINKRNSVGNGMEEVHNDIIVIGATHHNTLGVLRSLGYKGIKPFLILISSDKKSYVAKSKYIRKVYYLEEEKSIVPFLLDHFKNIEIKPIIIACYDGVESILDENYSLLNPFFLLPGSKSNGRISSFMSKDKMVGLASEVGFLCPESRVVDKNEIIDMDSINYPCILKPLVSKEGSKQDIKRCYNKEDFEAYLREKHCDRIQVQKLIEKDYEYQLIGVSLDEGKDVIIPGYSHIIRPSDVTNTGFLKYIPTQNLPVSFQLCKSFLERIGYTGLFSMEFIHGKDSKDYFMEINFRNDGNSICVTSSGLNLPYLYCISLSGGDVDVELNRFNTMKPVYVMPEFDDLILLLKGQVGIFTWIRDFRKTDCFMEFSKKDVKPFFYGLLGFVIRAIRFVLKKF